MHNLFKQRVIVLSISLFLFNNCSPTPLEYVDIDPKSPNYKKPEVPPDAIYFERLDSRAPSITWQGINNSVQYRYTIDDSISSDWIQNNSVDFTSSSLPELTSSQLRVLSNLAEGPHTIEIIAKNGFDDIGEPTKKTFTINAIIGPGVCFTPRLIESDNQISIMLENVNELLGAHIEIVCNDDSARFINFTEEDVSTESINMLMFDNFDTIESEKRAIINLIFFAGSNDVTDSITIGSIDVERTGTGMIEIDADKTVFRSIQNTEIIKNGLDKVKVY
ncbi:hypothetical protein ES708_05976 [subsurface metagenome]